MFLFECSCLILDHQNLVCQKKQLFCYPPYKAPSEYDKLSREKKRTIENILLDIFNLRKYAQTCIFCSEKNPLCELAGEGGHLFVLESHLASSYEPLSSHQQVQ